jgi:hypothetical protein
MLRLLPLKNPLPLLALERRSPSFAASISAEKRVATPSRERSPAIFMLLPVYRARPLTGLRVKPIGVP